MIVAAADAVTYHLDADQVQVAVAFGGLLLFVLGVIAVSIWGGR